MSMGPSAVTPNVTTASKGYPVPLKSSGSLDKYYQIDATPVIGTEFPTAKLVEWINAPDSDVLLLDLAIKISERGVVFFRAQDDLTNNKQKQLMQRLGELTGKPKSSGLHIHPIMNSEAESGGDPEINTISTAQREKFVRKSGAEDLCPKRQNTAHWHSDTAFEPVTADYTSLRLTQLPKTGGDTLWASGYEIYDRISEPYQRFLETLTATFAEPGYHEIANQSNFKLYQKERGAPENVGTDLKAVHPVVRTNPVTGWKSIYPVGGHVRHVNGLTEEESKHMLDWFLDLASKNYDLQVRFKWNSQNDIAIWDNRSVFHTAIFDCDNQGVRLGIRAVSIGEKPYQDPSSTSRRAALGLEPVGPNIPA